MHLRLYICAALFTAVVVVVATPLPDEIDGFVPNLADQDTIALGGNGQTGSVFAPANSFLPAQGIEDAGTPAANSDSADILGVQKATEPTPGAEVAEGELDLLVL